MDESLGYYVDLLIQQGDLVQLVGFYKSDPASKKYIDRNLNSIRQSLGFPTATSFRQIVEAFDKAKIDVITAEPPTSLFADPLGVLKYIVLILDLTREALKYAFDTKNLNIIKYAIRSSQHYLNDELFLAKVMAPLLEEFAEEFSMYPGLTSLLQEAIDATMVDHPHLEEHDGALQHITRGPTGLAYPELRNTIRILNDYLSDNVYEPSTI
ncbi:Hypothetical protein POVR1_LOCUS503 [uncultured virus]|nr:Hypothetical protein POVR1_LOCUS503 [uncultured virus]